MNNSAMYELANAGGIPYPETEKYQYDRWFTTTGLTDGGAYKTIRFNIQQDNLLLHWVNSYLELHGQVVKKADSTPYADNAQIALIHNAIPHMFANAKLTIGNQTVETINNVGHVSSMIYDVLFARSKGKNDGLQFMWVPDTAATAVEDDNKGFAIRQSYLIDTPHTNGKFKLRIPLYMIFGFMENFVALKGYPIEIELVRGDDGLALFRNSVGANAAAEGKLKFSELNLNIPVVDPSTAMTVKSLQGLQDPYPYLFSFRERHGMFAPVPTNILDFQQPITSSYFTERPQMIWVGFQRNNTTDQSFNHALYSHEDVESAYITMNNAKFPTNEIKANWAENDNGFFYEMQKDMRSNYLQHAATYTEGNMLTPANFKDLFTIYCFDVSKQDFTLGGNNVTCNLHVRFKTVTKANLRVYIAWVSDRTLELFTDGKPLIIRKQIDSYRDS